MRIDSILPLAQRSSLPAEMKSGSHSFQSTTLSENLPTLMPPHTGHPLRVRMEVLRDGEGLAKLAAHWDGLLDQSVVRTPFMRWDWTELWWQHFESDYHAVFGAAWAADGRLVALVPLAIGPGQTSVRRRLRVLSFFAGLGEVVAEGLDFMVVPGHEETLIRLIDHVLEEIRSEWDLAHFGYADETSPFHKLLSGALAKHGLNAEARNHQESPLIRLDEVSWEDYLMHRTANFRKKFRRNWTAAKRDQQMVIRQLDEAADAPWFVDQLHRLHGLRWTAEESLFLQPRAKNFHKALAVRWAHQGRVVLLVMEFNGQPVAANYAFVEGDQMWDYQGGWDVRYIELSPAKLINAENVRRAIERGIKVIDMLPGDLEYKSKWTQLFRKVVDFEAVNAHSVRARVFQSIRAVKKSLLKLLPGGESQP